ncbi:response regulator [Pseudokineococcus basanitobsidens]
MVLAGADDVEVVGEAVDGARAVAAARDLEPDVVLMDIRMPGTDGLAATEELLLRGPRDGHRPVVVVLTTFDADDHVLRALRAGAAGFLLKDTPPALLVEGLRTAVAGAPVLSPSVTRLLIARAVRESGDDRARAVVAGLSPRERDVVAGVGRGLSNAEVGAELHLSPATVKAHVSRLLTRLDLEGRVQLAVLARDADLL